MTPPSNEIVLAETKAAIEADADALLAISQDLLAYAKNKHRLGTGLAAPSSKHPYGPS
jgi:hypothetical protein